jgi:hypothetical protein
MKEIVKILKCFNIRLLNYLKLGKLLIPLKNSLILLIILLLKIKRKKLKSIRNNKLAFKKKKVLK